MSIDAIVTAVHYDPAAGTAALELEAADPSRAPAGQPSLTVIDPPAHLEGMIGTHIWGGASTIMVGDRKIADRLGYTSIRLTSTRPDPPEPGKIHVRCPDCPARTMNAPRRDGDLKSAAWRSTPCRDCCRRHDSARVEYFTIEDHRVYYSPRV